jgi:alkylation response protein AidB-like acyl-CoA dehydrogenase
MFTHLARRPRVLHRSVGLLSGTYGLTPEQIEFQNVALKFAKEELAPFADEWDKEGFFPIETMRKAAELGFASMYCSETNGGTGLSRLDTSIIFEALATGCNSTASYISIHNMCNWILDTYANENQRKQWQPYLHTFDMLSSYCLTEPSSGSDAGAMRTKAEKSGDDYILNGSKMFISGGSVSDLYIVMCKTGEKEVSCIAVEKGTPGLSFGKIEDKLGWKNMPTTTVIFDNVRVPKTNMIGEPGIGFKIALSGLDGGRVNVSSCAIGTAWSALEKALNYMNERSQFGKLLKDMDYLRFKVAEAATLLNTSRLVLRQAAHMLDVNHHDKTAHAAMAKLHATDSAIKIADLALQVHGGYGILRDYGMERMVRDLRIFPIIEGTNEVMRLVIGRSLFPK